MQRGSNTKKGVKRKWQTHRILCQTRAQIYGRQALYRRYGEKPVCEVCARIGTAVEKRGRIEAHHSNYNVPKRIIALCRRHHKAWHRIFLATYPRDIERKIYN